MTPNPTWHADPELLAGYVAGTLRRAQAASVEAHMLTCASCRAAMLPLAEPNRLDRNLAVITHRVDRPRLHPVERLLQRFGVPEHITRVLAITPSQHSTWLTGIAVALLIAAAADLISASGATLFVLLVAAPLLPLVAVTSVFSARRDPVREVIVAAPTPGLTLLLIRAIVVLGPTIVLATAASALVPARGWEAVLWLLPSFALTATTLALGTWFPLQAVAWVIGGGWVAIAGISAQGVPRAELVERYGAFRPTGQLVLVAVTLIASTVVAMRHDAFEFVDIGRTS